MRLIDADALIPMMKYATTDSEIGVFPIKIGFNAIIEVINNAPTIDAEPVIRCVDCKHNVANKKIDPLDITDYSGEDIVCDYFMTDGQEPDDYCSHAERIDQ